MRVPRLATHRDFVPLLDRRGPNPEEYLPARNGDLLDRRNAATLATSSSNFSTPLECQLLLASVEPGRRCKAVCSRTLWCFNSLETSFRASIIAVLSLSRPLPRTFCGIRLVILFVGKTAVWRDGDCVWRVPDCLSMVFLYKIIDFVKSEK